MNEPGVAVQPQQRGASTLVAAEVALGAVSVATVAGMWRLFADGSYFLPLLAHAVAAHVVTVAMRRRGTNIGVSAVVCLVTALLALTWGHLWSTTVLGFPTPGTLSTAADQLETAWRTFGEVRAPAPVLPGFLVSAGAALWVGAWLADLAAFRLWTPFEALIPGGTLFVFASLFSADRARLMAGALWLAAALGFVLLHRTTRQRSSPSWIGSDPRVGTNALVKVGAGLALGAISIAVLVAPHLPGADAAAVVPFAPENQDGSRTTVSPLVEIRRRLVDQSLTQMFSVQSNVRAYWRLTSLDIFDGEVWSSRGSFGEADGDLGDPEGDHPTTEVIQRFSITGLTAIWLPATYQADSIDAGDEDVRWDDVSSTLIVSTDYATSDGIAYDVTSQMPVFDQASLAAATGDTPDEVLDRGLDLPSDFPASVTAEAQRIVAGATTPFDQALALQNSFRDGSFVYSLDVPAGHSDSAIEDFLFNTRTGYCEQFAGTFAAMARAVGLPARVAVGFTTGDPDPVEPGRYSVNGEHAHAWPEVWIPGAGWVAFEPTPGRGAPGAEDYTGVPESQDTAGESTAPSTSVVPVPDSTPAPDATGDTTPQPSVPSASEPDPTADGSKEERNAIVAALWLATRIVVDAVLAIAVAAAGVAGTRAVRRRRRRSRAAADGPDALVGALWQEATELGPLVGVQRRAFETPTEVGRRLADAAGEPGASALAQLATRAAFDPVALDDDDAAGAQGLLDRLRAAVADRTRRSTRLLAAVDPRPVHRRGRRRGRGENRPAGRIHLVRS